MDDVPISLEELDESLTDLGRFHLLNIRGQHCASEPRRRYRRVNCSRADGESGVPK